MTIEGKCKILRIYLDEELKWGNKLLYRAMIDTWLEAKIAGASVFKGVEGYGSSYHLHTPRIVEVMENLPMLLEVVDTPKNVLRALNLIEEMLPTHCLVAVQDIYVLHYHAKDGKHKKTHNWPD